ncbi:hypothetical protein SAMN02800687_1161 [Curtobacterium sp. UNCCL20]|uniref:hypothetical protein n=1 Tax=Curtobacterium sp. UNCCL20 TaxID=1502773 RepID=UPI000890A29E|nr:hypothetical protein [Curtobacterium sp. UNCCL20]SDQ27309.1 hypothetical protein SAMN02800687_1161 [Curtobacterium sp. UNCCL20]
MSAEGRPGAGVSAATGAGAATGDGTGAVTGTGTGRGHDRVYRRVVRRETSASRSGTVVVAMLVLLVIAAAAVFAAALVLLDQRVLGIDPRDVVDRAARAPRGLDTTITVGIAAIVAFLGLVFLAQGLLPQRRPRHAMSSDRLAVVVDDEVLASAAARAARSATRLGPDAAVGTVGRRTVDVVLRPAAGVDVPAVAATEAVTEEFAAIHTEPPVTARVRVQPTGRVDG